MRITDLETKTILGITGVIVIVAVVVSYFSDWILFLSAPFGFLILMQSKKNETSRFIGLLSLKPVIGPFLGIVTSSKLYEFFPYFPDEIILAFLWAVPELLLTLLLVYAYRHLFDDRIARAFLLGDIVRWASLTIVFLLPDPFPEPYFYPQLYILVFFLIFYPPLYAITGLIVLIRRAHKNKSILQMAN